MVLNVSQTKKIVGKFCTKVTKNEDCFRVYFKIKKSNKKSLGRVLKHAKGVKDGDSNYLSGYIEVIDDPSNAFGKSLKTEKEKKLSYKKERKPSYTKKKNDYFTKDSKHVKTKKSKSSKDKAVDKSKKSSSSKNGSSKDKDDDKKGFFSRLTGK